MILSVRVFAQEIPLDPPFLKHNIIQLNYIQSPTGGNDLVGALISSKGEKNTLPARCHSEGGDAQLGDVYTLKSPAKILVLTCIYQVNHSGLGIKGTDNRALVFEDKNGELQQRHDIENIISGYEGTSEEGNQSYFFYDDRDLATLKIQQPINTLKEDPLALAHKIIIKRLRNHDHDALSNYISTKRITNLIKKNPISPRNANLYNDIGFALSEIGKKSEALNLLYYVEQITPERAVLMLNIADALWDSGKTLKSKGYYLKYKNIMSNQSKTSLIPARVNERINN